jgi:branched-chain amino acid transport system permease protein
MTSFLHRPSHWVPLVLMAALAALPFVAQAIGQPFYIALVARMLAYAVAASALNLALGYGGMVGFGHALFMGIGSYAVALPAFHGADNGLLHVLIALAACGLTAFVTGLVSLRTTGIGFIMITLAFAQMGYYLFVSLKQYGGDDGMTLAAPSRLGPFTLGSATAVYAAGFIVLALQTWWMHRLRTAPFGMVLRAARQNPRRVAAVGFPVLPYRLAAYVISAMLCGLSGVLLAYLNAFASPATLSWSTSGDLIVIVVLGGIGTVFGPVLGAIAFLGMEEVLKSYTEHWMVIFGPVIVILALVGRTGLMGALAKLDRSASPAAGGASAGGASVGAASAAIPPTPRAHRG